jgi:4-coumarate--CoA ligase
VFTTPSAAKNVVKVGRKNSSFVKQIVLFGTDNPFEGKATLFDAFMAGQPEATDFHCDHIDMVNHTALILCSSGTTGLPKGVQLTQYNLLVCAAHML